MKKFICYLIFALAMQTSVSTCFAQNSFHALDSITQLYYEKYNYDSAYYYGEKALAQAEILFGKNDTNYAASLSTLVELCYFRGKYEQGIIYGIISKDLYKELRGEKHSDYAYALNILSLLYQDIGNNPKAERLMLETMKIWKETLGEKHRNYSSSLNNLAMLYKTMGNYSSAEPLFLETIKIKKEVLGEKHPSYALSLNNLAQLYQSMGNNTKAEPLYLEAIKIRKETIGVKHPFYATGLNNLAALYQDMGNYFKAEPLYMEAMKVRKEVLGEKHPDYATSLSNMAALYMNMGDCAKAEPLFLEALNIQKESLGEKHPSFGTSLNNLAMLYKAMGAYSKAEPLFLEARKIWKETFGEKHPDYLLSLNNLANLYKLMCLNKKAEPLYFEALNIRYVNLQSNFGNMSENEKEKYIATNNKYFNDFFDFAYMCMAGSKHKKRALTETRNNIIGGAYNLSLTTKGLLLAGNIQIQHAIMQSGDSLLKSKYNTWKETKELSGSLQQMSAAKVKKMGYNLDSIENVVNTLEKQLSQKSNVFASERKLLQYTWQEVQQNLAKNEVAIEFITYTSTSFSVRDSAGSTDVIGSQPSTLRQAKCIAIDSTWYCALVLRGDAMPPIMIHLCTKEQLEDILNTRPIYNSNIYSLVWKPLEQNLSGVENIYMSLAGLLNRVPFAMLTDEAGNTILSKYNLHLLNNTRELAIGKLKVVSSGKQQNKSATILGGAIYDFNADLAMMQKHNNIARNENIKLAASASLSESGAVTGEGTWSYLPGTLFEADAIADLFEKNNWNTTEYSGYKASEENIKMITGSASPNVLHISTHGYFVSAPDTTVYNHSKNPFKLTNNSLMRSGLILAGGNRAWQGNPQIDGTEDGVLTSYEVSNMYLPNTELVVLSACETGLGDIKGGEGVYGLQRAFQVAGAKSIIMSLWQVPDDETMMLMSSFYTKWFATGNIHQSFREAQLEMSKKYEPFYWAAFVLVE